MSRYRWFELKKSASIRNVASRLQARRYLAGTTDGFLIEQVRESFIRATYVERDSKTESIFDPFGNEEKFNVVEYRKSEFSLSNESPGFELKDPGRSSTQLISRLVEAMEFDFTITPLHIDPLLWAYAFQNYFGGHGMIDKMQIGSLRLDNGVVAQISFKGISDVSDVAKRFVGTAQYEIERVQLRLPARKGAIVFFRSGGVTISSERDSDWLDAIRLSLRNPVQIPN